MPESRKRRSVRAIVLDPGDRVLLCRHDLTALDGPVVWAMPGGGVEPGETDLRALRRELMEEIGLRLDGDPPLVWHQEVSGPGYAPGYDGVINRYHLVRVPAFVPNPAWSAERLAAEHIHGMRWWRLAEIAAGDGGELFSPRDLAGTLGALLAGGAPDEPVRLGL
ncbi:8-oxo-dGTP pyrophosphatase MutT (NUDIX family) [Nonomuraea fuscirosea]|uniref:8-oxo-dGTP pyrophosphatase MutT (NUDIX family) n=1 Tax=Nonomuraea fuscirosea TaxID=1291556 RepID=A0A2T0N1Y0_9ACTN|nr:NUDIX domain-containing protein [Nonomuraea fuscirosea]PRX65946.1 8-oxo-dGTP pyrophosphatase MutT (NUDIX family) [Nonomuraea fuscirosea]